MRNLIENHISSVKDNTYLLAFKKDIHNWSLVYHSLYGKILEKKSLLYTDNKKNKIYIANNIELSRMSHAISDSLNNISIMAYRYGVFNQEKFYNINASKFIGQFIFDFMRYLPVNTAKESTANPRRVNARVALYLMKILMSLSATKEEYDDKMYKISAFLKEDLESEIIFKLADRQLTEEWLYIYCKTIRKLIE